MTKLKMRITDKGYIEIYNPNHPNANMNGYIREHRLIMEKHIGRLLEWDEEVHHINRDKQDNRIENLKLFSNHSEHLKFHHKVGKFRKS